MSVFVSEKKISFLFLAVFFCCNFFLQFPSLKHFGQCPSPGTKKRLNVCPFASPYWPCLSGPGSLDVACLFVHSSTSSMHGPGPDRDDGGWALFRWLREFRLDQACPSRSGDPRPVNNKCSATAFGPSVRAGRRVKRGELARRQQYGCL